ncbi:biotin carboxylase N-terminal domain-containing protein [Arenicella xantha]|uniref:Biotin carboxyl carrier protein n=1 Tax=Arenicella xantha TaxID=644221 RepID=A0A395JLR4_9GAMM|nr:biotin carboxylase N-terminal domain-containing protein [Arenicella xantha]RBP51539.1 biotin carboxyl carrier protein [Arenicella xantha]
MNTKDHSEPQTGQLLSLFKDIERRANNLSLNGTKHPFKWHENIDGLLSHTQVEATRQQLKKLSVDDYVAKVLDPAESATRPNAKTIISQLRGKIHQEFELGPLYSIELSLEYNGGTRRLAFIAQNRHVANGVWSPEHHLEACRLADEYARRAVPIITFMDTPGADASTEANAANQAHSISRLIAVMAAAKVPSIGIIYGLGYSGGAIPLATTNVLLAVRNAAFNTIQPKGLANIARQYNLSWQESARYVGVSPSELYRSGAIDGVIDWDPSDKEDDKSNLVAAIFTGVQQIEADAKREVLENAKVGNDYLANVRTERLHRDSFDALQKAAKFELYGELSEYPSVYSHAMMYLRSLSMRCRIHSATIETYGRLADKEIPKGDLKDRTRQLREQAFEQWLSDPEKLVYNDQLAKAWSNLKSKREELSTDRNKITALILGDPQANYISAQKNYAFILCLYLYNRWKSDAAFNFVEMSRRLDEMSESGDDILAKPEADLTLLDTINEPSIRKVLQDQFRDVLVFDALYNNIVENFGEIAEESKAFESLSEKTLRKILDSSLEEVASSVKGTIDDGAVDSDIKSEFAKWLGHFVKYDQRGEFLADVEEWKRVNFPRMSDSLLVLITYFFETLVPRFIDSQMNGKAYNGQINPWRIGKRKDFWNQLNIAYQDLLIQRVLASYKRQKTATVDAFKQRFFTEFSETSANKMTANPVSFPGFRQSIEKALNNNITPCGVITGIGEFKLDDQGNTHEVGVLISNVAFQAGAFDMAGAEKLCTLLVDCADRGLPVVCFVSSGGMQTKEGPSSLFSMAIVNDRITNFIADTGLPVMVFGFGDCTGGSQASFVTHPLVHTYYLSGTDMPFAGRVVVPSFLPSMATTSNYLANTPGAMQGLVKHPFAEGLDEKLREVDPNIELPNETINEVVAKVISGSASMQPKERQIKVHRAIDKMGKIEKVLIHARGCTAVKLIRVAQSQGYSVLLVQSDPDMDSAACDMLTERDEVVCLGGQTPGESYLNGLSVVTIARTRDADSLHPGIGFLSENAGFARLCRANGLNFIGPKASSMDTMGNKSNAISTAMANNVPVVPGSHGILTSAEATAKVADDIGYPVLLKAVHGGGGKGIKVVRSASEIKSAFDNVYSEARSAFGNGDLYLEKFVESMRHIEVQILRDTHGCTQVLGLRDCTVQRNNQKVLEESGSTMLPKDLEKMAYECAANLADAVDYFGAGTVEFIYDLAANTIYFMEMNTRLQVEHPVTEWTSGVPIVAKQFQIAEGASIKDLKIGNKGFSIEARITAEKARLDSDGTIDFLPTPGLVTECRFPEGSDIEVIASVSEGKTISPFYDSMIAQLVVHGKNRKDAIRKLIAALDATVIKGVCTNISLLKRILIDPTFVKGDYDTGYLPAFLDTLDKKKVVEEMAYTGVEEADSDLSSLKIAGTDEIKVISPMTGIYYATPSPNEPEFAKVGDVVNLSQTLCQVEAMKLFTHISLSSVPGSGEIFTAENQYEIVRVNQANNAQVNSGDLLFVVKPV